jgi:hypothetical protein
MSPRRLLSTATVLAVAAATPFVPSAGSMAAYRPVIGKPVSVPVAPLAGKRFTVTFKVTRSDNGRPLRAGTMVCEPSSAGKVIPHVESFNGGKAKLRFVVPSSAKTLRVNVTIASGGQSTKRVTTFKVAGGYIPTLSVADATIAEGNAGSTTLAFPVRLSAKSTDMVSVAFATAGGTATAPADYASGAGTLTFKPGETAKTITVAVVGDATYEPDETVTLTLSKPVNATITDGSATGTITNDDMLATPGRYSGKTSQNETFDFDVPASGAQVTGLRIGQVNLSCTACSEVLDAYGRPHRICRGGQRGLWIVRGSTSRLPFDFGAELFPIAQDRTFTVDKVFDEVIVYSESGENVPAKLSVAVAGRFADAGASGTMLVALTFVTGGGDLYTVGGDWTCTSYPQTWAVTRSG